MSVHEAMNIVKAFSHSEYTLRRKVLTLLGARFHLYDPSGNLVLFSHMKALKLRDDLRLYTNEDMTTEILSIKARKILDFSSAFDVIDSENQEKIGVLKRKGLKSTLVRDEWIVMDADERDIGLIQEDSTWLGLVRRFFENVSWLLPQSFHVHIGGQTVATFQQNRNPFVQKLSIVFSPDAGGKLDPRLGIAAAIVIMAVEGRQR
jgi:uncharacterized protein YxjI